MGSGLTDPGITPAYVCGMALAAALALVSLGVLVYGFSAST